MVREPKEITSNLFKLFCEKNKREMFYFVARLLRRSDRGKGGVLGPRGKEQTLNTAQRTTVTVTRGVPALRMGRPTATDQF